MDKRLEKLLKEIFALSLKVNSSTEFKVRFDIQPCFYTDQIWYGVFDDASNYHQTRASFRNSKEECIKEMEAFKQELKEILRQNGGK